MRITVIGYAPIGAARTATGTFRTLDDALAYSPTALDHLHTHRILQAGEIRFNSGEAQRLGMGPSFGAQK